MKVSSIIFDADGTLLDAENPYIFIAKALGCESELRPKITEYLDGIITYEHLIEIEEKLFAKSYTQKFGREPKIGDIERFLPLPEIKEGAEELIELLNKRKTNVFVLSSGFLYLIEILTAIKIKIKKIFANRFIYDTRGDFIGIKVDISGEKVEEIQKIISNNRLKINEVVYVGDNFFDKKVIDWMLAAGGTVFFLKNKKTEFALKEKPQHPNFKEIDNLQEIGELIR
jgi:HAD superfamily phosphoserine phosphatase-like hydrolase